MVSIKNIVDAISEINITIAVKKYRFSEKAAGCRLNIKIAAYVPCHPKYVSFTC